MNWDDVSPKTVNSFIVSDMVKFKDFCDEHTPKSLRDPEPIISSFMGIRVRISSAIPPNKIAICDNRGIIGFFDMEPEPPEMA